MGDKEVFVNIFDNCDFYMTSKIVDKNQPISLRFGLFNY